MNPSHPPVPKGKTYIDVFGEKKANEIKKKLSDASPYRGKVGVSPMLNPIVAKKVSDALKGKSVKPSKYVMCSVCGEKYQARGKSFHDRGHKYLMEDRMCLNPDCRIIFRVKSYDAKKYCCVSHHAQMRIGKKNPNYRSGLHISERVFDKNGVYWFSARKKTLDRDKNLCQNCGNKGDIVHHIIPFRISLDHSLNNLETVCHICHPIVEGKGVL